MNLIALKRIKYNGKRYEPNQVLIDVDDISSKRLVDLNVAKETDTPILVVTEEQKNEKITDEILIPPVTFDDGLGTPGDSLTDEQVAEMISKHFKLEILKDEAKSIGMDFVGNISKTDLIDLIIDKELEDHFLDQIPE